MTLEAWVNPTGAGADWRTVVLKERPGFMVYALYADTDTGRPRGHVFIGGSDLELAAPAAVANNAWTHLAATYDGANLRLYVNGTLVSTRAVTRQHERLHRRAPDRRQRASGASGSAA